MNEQIRIHTSNLTLATFATFGNSTKFRDYSARHNLMSQSCLREGVALLTYSFVECSSPGMEIVSRTYPMRKGAGYWAWKPELIKNAVKKSATRYVLYVDVDLGIKRLDKLLVDSSINQYGVALFETKESIADWTSARCLRRFKISRSDPSPIFSASAVLIDSQNNQALGFLDAWENALNDYRNILDPVFTLKTNHRHDQSVLSCLIATCRVSTSRFAHGFYQTGVDNGSQTSDSAWLIHGDIQSEPNKGLKKHFKEFRSFVFHKYELINFILSNFRFRRWIYRLKMSGLRRGTK